MKLLLFDIDGTLLNTFRAGQQAANRAFHKLFGIENAMDGIRTDGLTDPLILKMMSTNCLQREFDNMESLSFYREYLNYLDDELKNSGRISILPGVFELLDTLEKRPDCVLALGTGNIEDGAWIKLDHAGLRHYFSIGGFGSDSEHRDELISIGIRKASKKYNRRMDFDQVFVIGDTPHDITHGRTAGAVTVGVGTGNYTMDELSKSRPDYLLKDLTDKTLQSVIL